MPLGIKRLEAADDPVLWISLAASLTCREAKLGIVLAVFYPQLAATATQLPAHSQPCRMGRRVRGGKSPNTSWTRMRPI